MEFIGKTLLIEVGGKKILVVGDLHLGYEEVLNKAGVFVSRQMFDEMIEYLDKVFEKTGSVNEVVLLGDVKHDFGSIVKQEWTDVSGLFDYLKEKCGKIIVIKGNHDNYLKNIALKRGIDVKDFYVVNEFCFVHGDRDFPDVYDKKIKHWIVGHAHSSVKLSDGVKVEKYKCFFVGKHGKKNVTVVPSFFYYYEGSDPRETWLGLAWDFDLNKFNVKVVSGDGLEVLDFGRLGELR